MLSLLLTICLATVSHGGALDDKARLTAADIRSVHPDVAARVDEMQPIRNRAGSWYFPGADLTNPLAQTLIKDRIRARRDEASIRIALVYALEPENRFAWREIQAEEPSVRVAMLHGYKGLNTSQSGEILARALQDGSSSVRAEAARLVGYRNDVESLSSSLMVVLSDPSEDVRRLAVRSLGWLQVKEAFVPVSAMLQDAAPSVRVAAVRALANIDHEQARSLPAISTMKADEDLGVQRAVKRVLQP